MKVRFPYDPQMTTSIKGHKFEITRPFKILVGAIQVIIPMGFWTDLASTGIFSPLNKTMYPAILHDWLYYKQMLGGYPLERKQADVIFLRAMETTEVNYFKRKMYYYGVRVGGWKPWNKYKNDRLKKNVEIHKQLIK